MVAKVTEGVKVSVITEYMPEHSSPVQFHYVFSYRIRIENHSEYTVQLLKRHWFIHDATSISVREVQGEGVVGRQPILEPGEYYEYVSGCNLKSGIGKMVGTYTMERIFDGTLFEVQIPEFTMVVPFKLN